MATGRCSLKNVAWTELGTGDFVKRHETGGTNIAAVAGPLWVRIIDTRRSGAEALEIAVGAALDVPVVGRQERSPLLPLRVTPPRGGGVAAR